MAESLSVPRGFVLDEPDDGASSLPEGFQLDVEAGQEDGFSVTETIKNIPDSAVQLGKDMINPILHPVDTAKNLHSLASGVAEKLFQPKEINGFNFGQTEDADTVDAVGEFIKERYGSLDAFTNTVQEDPVGVVADMAGLFTGGTSLIPKVGKAGQIAGKVEAIGKAIDPLNASVSGVKAFAKSGKLIPESVPVKLLESALKFRPSIKQSQRTNMTKTALKEGILPTVSGLKKITDTLDGLDTKLNAIIDRATTNGVSVPKKAVLTELGKLRRDLGGVKVNAGRDLKIIDNMAKEFDANLKRIKKDRLTPRELQDLKTDAYTQINFDKSQGSAGFAKNETTKAMARRAKELIEDVDADIKPTNKRIGDLLELNKEMNGVVNRLDNRNLISLDTAAKIGAGAATGTEAGTALGTGAAVMGSPKVKARTALLLENIRQNAGTIEVINNKLPPVLTRALLTQAGRLNESLQAAMDEEE